MRKYIAILLIVIILLVIGFTQFSEFNKKNDSINVGRATFTLPKGYEIGPNDALGGNTINNGTNKIGIKEKNDENISRYLNEYIAYHNNSVHVDNFVIDGNNISRTSVSNDTNTHDYFVVKNHKVYDFYASDGNKKMDSTIISMITSI